MPMREIDVRGVAGAERIECDSLRIAKPRSRRLAQRIDCSAAAVSSCGHMMMTDVKHLVGA